ncbi:MAG: PAS domain-containing protein [Alphaproteobacteria bacterium]|nr:PAS domain-containing protein [Alphaproteobacteria bacterium]
MIPFSGTEEKIGVEGKPIRELDAPTAKVTKALHELWLLKKGGRDMPARRDLSPAEMKSLLPHIYMIDVLGGGADYQMRLFGTALVDMIGGDFTGARLSEQDADKGWRGKIYKQAYWRARPVFYQFDLGDMGKPHIHTENVLLPLKDNNNNFTILLCASQVIGREKL